METTPTPTLPQLLDAANQIILGKPDAVKMALVCLLAGGHLLIEDLPGVGKTTLAHTLAKLLGLDYQRIQFTSDLLPTDVVGVSIYDQSSESFCFHPGPIFSQLVLADEINRATPKTQSALLEAMEERQVTVDGESRPLPKPFFVIATQNPSDQVGTFSLPESQLDRFLMRISMGYPEPSQERELLRGKGGRRALDEARTLLDVSLLFSWQDEVENIFVAEPMYEYIQLLISETRDNASLSQGLSPRAGLSLLAAAKAWAWIEGRSQLIPEDVQAVWSAVASHRFGDTCGAASGAGIARSILESVEIP
jgi:MoxR-like ATPase